jgi:hypothetical protein
VRTKTRRELEVVEKTIQKIFANLGWEKNKNGVQLIKPKIETKRKLTNHFL